MPLSSAGYRAPLGAAARRATSGFSLQDVPEWEGAWQDEDYVGPPKLPGDRTLANIERELLLGLSEEEYAEKLTTNTQFGQDEGFQGPPKLPGDRALADSRNPNLQLLLPEEATTNPVLQEEILGRRHSVEGYHGLNLDDLSREGSPYESIVAVNPTFRNRGFAALGLERGEHPPSVGSGIVLYPETEVAGEKFTSIEDFQLTHEQRQRYNALVRSGDIDPDLLWEVDPRTQAFRPQDARRQYLSVEDAVNIIIGPNDPAPSRWDESTGFEYSQDDIDRAERFYYAVAQAQGLPIINTRSSGMRYTNLGQRQFPVGQEYDRWGLYPTNRTPQSYQRNRATMEERLLIAELFTGQRRAIDDWRDPPPSYEDTLLSGGFIV